MTAETVSGIGAAADERPGVSSLSLVAESSFVVVAAAAFIASVASCVAIGIAFGYDEALYAELTRHWLTGSPLSAWGVHRPMGLAVLGLPLLVAGGGAEWTLRLFGLFSGVGVVVSGWWFARSVGGPLAGIVAAVAFAAAAPLQVESSSFLTDVPATFALLAMAMLLWRQLSGPAPISRSVMWLAALAAAAFYARYGSIVALAGLAIGAWVAAPRRITENRTIVVATIGLTGLLLLPHMVMSVLATRTPWGIVLSALGAADHATTLPLLDYGAWFPIRIMGPAAAAVVIAGFVPTARAIVGRPIRSASPPGFARFVLASTLPQVLVLSILVHAEPRYLLFPMSLLVVLGAAEIGPRLSRLRSRKLMPTLAGIAVAALLLGGVLSIGETEQRVVLWDWKREVGLDIASDAAAAGGVSCLVVTADATILSWYSECPAVNVRTPEAVAELLHADPGDRYIVVTRAEAPAEARTLVGDAHPWRTYRDGNGRAVADVYRIRGAP